MQKWTFKSEKLMCKHYMGVVEYSHQGLVVQDPGLDLGDQNK